MRTTRTTDDIWTFSRELSSTPLDVQGFEVEATDGHIGRVDEATYDVGSACVVVDTGPWIFGRKVVIPAGAIERIDLDGKKLELRLTKDQIKDSPEYESDDDRMSPTYRERVGTYFSRWV